MKGIVRVKKTTDFVVMDKTALQDERLSWKAKGLIAYLLSKPDDWSVYVAHLLKQSPDGRHAVYSGLKELEQAGYLVRTRKHDSQGRFQGFEYVVYERPVTLGDPFRSPYAENPDMDETRAAAVFSPYAENPNTVPPFPEKPYTENPDTATKYRSQSFTKNDLNAAVAARAGARENEGAQLSEASPPVVQTAASQTDDPSAPPVAPADKQSATTTAVADGDSGSECDVLSPATAQSLSNDDNRGDKDREEQARPATLTSVSCVGADSPLAAVERAFCELTGRKQASARDLHDMAEALTLTEGDVELIVLTMEGKSGAFRPGYPGERIQSFAYFFPAIVEAVSRRSHYERDRAAKYGPRMGSLNRRQSYNKVLDHPPSAKANTGAGIPRFLRRRQSYDDLFNR